MALGKNVKTLREARGWTLKDLSKRSGVPVGTIGALEVRDSVRSEYAAKLAKGFGIPLEDLLPATVTATITGQLPPLTASVSIQNNPPAPVNTAPAAINGIARLDCSIDCLAAYLAEVDPSKRAAVTATMAAVIADPSDINMREALVKMLTPAAFASLRNLAA